MKVIIVTLVLSAVAFALPQAPPALSSSGPVAPKPSITNPTATIPKVPGQLPKDGLKGLPFPDNFGQFASQLGFDPAKATPNPSGPSDVKCQSSPNGQFCFSPSGGSFSLGHPGGAFNGANWNPLTGGATGGSGGLLAGGIGSADDFRKHR